MTRFTRRIVTAVATPALVVALVQVPAITRPTTGSGQQQSTAAPQKVCILNPVWGDAPCLL